MKTLVFDMDGTIADLYGQVEWLKRLRSEDVTVFENAAPIYNMIEFNEFINNVKHSCKVVIVTWLPKECSKRYGKKVRKAKIDWLVKHGVNFDEIHCVKYGTNKKSVVKKYENKVLIDDSKEVLKSWGKDLKINASERNVINELKALFK